MRINEVTGYPSIDKPWLKYYKNPVLSTLSPECSMYEYLLRNNKEYQNNTALIYFDRKISYEYLFSLIEKAANAFSKLGIVKGDIVTIQALSLPQVVVMIYALSKIGATANLVYVTLNAKEVRENLISTQSKVFVTIDTIYHSYDADIQTEHLQTIVLLSVADEMDFVSKMVFSLKSKASFKTCRACELNWKTFLKIGNEGDSEACGSAVDPVIMVYTGGTTGKSKAVMLSNANMNFGALQYMPLGFERHKSFLSVLPPFIAFGLTVTIHMPLVFGIKSILCVSANPSEISGFVEKYKPNYIVCGTAQAEKMMNALQKKNTDLSSLSFLGVGGEALSNKLEDDINIFLNAHHSPTRIVQGYAMSETAASSTAARADLHMRGTVGIPFVYTTVKIVNADTLEELPYGEKGEICIHSPSTMIGYYKNDEETNSILKTHQDGLKWVHTGDIGYMDENGFLTIVGRIKRMILVAANDSYFKVFPKLLEDELLKSGCIKAISIVGRPHKEKHNELIAFIVPHADVSHEKVVETLMLFAEAKLEKHERPIEYIVVSELPLTTVGKVDYRQLESRLCTTAK